MLPLQISYILFSASSLPVKWGCREWFASIEWIQVYRAWGTVFGS